MLHSGNSPLIVLASTGRPIICQPVGLTLETLTRPARSVMAQRDRFRSNFDQLKCSLQVCELSYMRFVLSVVQSLPGGDCLTELERCRARELLCLQASTRRSGEDTGGAGRQFRAIVESNSFVFLSEPSAGCVGQAYSILYNFRT